MSYRLTPLARRDLRSIFAYTAELFGDRQADAYRDLLNQALERIGKPVARSRGRSSVMMCAAWRSAPSRVAGAARGIWSSTARRTRLS